MNIDSNPVVCPLVGFAAGNLSLSIVVGAGRSNSAPSVSLLILRMP